MTTTTAPQQQRTRSTGIVLIAATLFNGVMAGVWFAYSTSVMGALARQDDRTYIGMMQDINIVIRNPLFFLGMLGALALPAFAAWQLRKQRPVIGWVLAGTALYLAAFFVTMGANVPLNDALDAAGDPAKIASPASVRADFEDPWVMWNHIRGILNVAAVVCLSRALILFGRRTARTAA
ncbi:DUF1772 domain-containing protein [Streptomyces sp. NPDC050418]|uniref:DUF1772 domain-containing protein n=1 Tax=Streptomyces sp. NPDC050418 TaxID=3365612 RepID=UPI003792FB70